MLELLNFTPLIDPTSACQRDKRFVPDTSLPLNSPIPCRVIKPWVCLMASQKKDAEQHSQLLFGELFFLFYNKDGWAYGQSVIDGYLGWVKLEDITLTPDEAPNATITQGIAKVFMDPADKSKVLTELPFAAQVALIDNLAKSGFIAIESGGWISAKSVAKLPYSGVTLLDSAESFLNAPYEWGGRTKTGLDCSALVQLSLAATGLRVHRDSDLQWESVGVEIDPKIALRGDLVFFPGHVGIMYDEENVLHANQTRKMVSIDPLDDVVSWVKEDLTKKASDKKSLTGFKRIL